jgi:thiamine biosynthesis lipoprotein
LRKSEKVVELSLPGIKVDLGGIAKGYAIDCVVRKLKALGIKNCMINAGGQVYCLGHKSGKPWKIAVQDPRAMTTKGTLELVDAGVSTSGDYEQFFTRGNRSFSHIMNPKTGYPADSGIISVSVVSPSATTADALSTAIFVLGEEKGRLLAAKFPGTVVTIIKSDNI